MDQSTDEMREKRVELILQQLEAVPSLPDLATLQSNPTFATQLLKLITTIGRETFTSVEQFVQKRGEEPLRYAVLALATYETFATKPRRAGSFQKREYWNDAAAGGGWAGGLA